MDRDGFQRAMGEHGDRIYSYAVWMLGDPEEARDVVQEALMRLWKRRGEVAAAAGRTWLMRTVYRLCIDRLRRRSRRRETALEQAVDLPSIRPGCAEHAAELSELQTAVAKSVSRLSPRDRALIVMREMQDMSYQEMAGVLDTSVNTLKPALHRARERLGKELARVGAQP